MPSNCGLLVCKICYNSTNNSNNFISFCGNSKCNEFVCYDCSSRIKKPNLGYKCPFCREETIPRIEECVAEFAKSKNVKLITRTQAKLLVNSHNKKRKYAPNFNPDEAASWVEMGVSQSLKDNSPQGSPSSDSLMNEAIIHLADNSYMVMSTPGKHKKRNNQDK